MKQRALFLDRDGVINIDHGYVHRAEEIEFVDGVFDLVSHAKHLGYLIVVVTNQAGIGRGYYTEEEFHRLMEWMTLQFRNHQGNIDAIYFCPYHPDHGVGEYRRKSECRKPAPGMLLQAQREWNIDMQRSIFIGDTLNDMAAGRAAGVGSLLHLNGDNGSDDTIVIARLSQASPYLCPLPC